MITLNVTTSFDQNDGTANNGLSLRDAIIFANANPTNEYIIELQAGQTYVLTQNGINEDQAKTGDLDILGNITVKTSNGSPAIIDARGFTTRDRVFQVIGTYNSNNVNVPTAILTLDNVIVTGGLTNSNGGGVYVNNRYSTLNVFQSTISGNGANNGGGLYNNGNTKIVQSTVNDNESEYFGGGIYNNGALNVENSTLSENTTNRDGGGIYNRRAMIIANTTITKNIADSDGNNLGNGGNGGGIYSNIYGNIYNNVTLRNTIVAGNFDNSKGNNPTINPDIRGNVTGNNNNLIGDLRGASGTIGQGTDIVNSNIRLAPLGFYGGLTKTHALYSGSPALNAGNNALIPQDTLDQNNNGIIQEFVPYDQRGSGFDRIQDTTVDIGAFEGVLPPTQVNTPIYRFQNTSVPGTYLFVGEAEAQSIRQNFRNFREEGVAFKVATQPGDSLIAFNRFQNTAVPGTYLYAGESESENIRKNFRNFREEGIAFYAYDPSNGQGNPFNRFQNLNLPGTYLFAGAEESAGIRQNFPSFADEGVAFGAA